MPIIAACPPTIRASRPRSTTRGRVGEAGRDWIRSKPFGHNPRESARFLIDFGYVLQLLDLHAGMSLVELGCGSGWMTRFAARHGVHAEGYDISPEMIEIAREEAAREGLDVASRPATTSSSTSAAASTPA